MYQPLDGPSKQFKMTVDTITVQEVQDGGTPLDERKVITLQPNSKVYVYFGNGTTIPNAATVAADGFVHFKDSKDSYEASNTQPVFILAVTGTVDVIVAERS